MGTAGAALACTRRLKVSTKGVRESEFPVDVAFSSELSVQEDPLRRGVSKLFPNFLRYPRVDIVLSLLEDHMDFGLVNVKPDLIDIGRINIQHLHN